MKLNYSRKTVTKTLRAEIQQGLYKHVDLQRIVIVRLLVLSGTWQCVQHVEHFFRGALASDRHYQFVGRGCAGKRT